MEDSRIDSAVTSALETWLWSEHGHDGSAIDESHGVDDVAVCEVAEWRSEIQSFMLIADENGMLEGITDEQLGHDFTLTRNGHGAGFWDRGNGAQGEWLTEMCKPFGECAAYVGDDGKIGRI